MPIIWLAARMASSCRFIAKLARITVCKASASPCFSWQSRNMARDCLATFRASCVRERLRLILAIVFNAAASPTLLPDRWDIRTASSANSMASWMRYCSLLILAMVCMMAASNFSSGLLRSSASAFSAISLASVSSHWLRCTLAMTCSANTFPLASLPVTHFTKASFDAASAFAGSSAAMRSLMAFSHGGPELAISSKSMPRVRGPCRGSNRLGPPT
mmetsp:Transcript_102206/g.312608  ORF Transcript_102206/g.312608 Transcript_102206/m.312608 type:complete len:217 (-) Transcript_102206:2-652(-)